MLGKILAVLEFEFFLSGFLSGARGHIALRGGIAQNGGAKMLVNKNSRVVLWRTISDGCAETIVDHTFGV